VDLLVPFRNFDYYHPDQLGHASLKSVLPALTGKSYEGMEIADGATANLEFMRVTFGEVSAAERNRVRAALEKYCALDTGGMVEIVRKLEEATCRLAPRSGERPPSGARRVRGKP
jgi:hypothetical protein